MTGKPEYRVATAGLETREVRLIEIIFRHSRYNRYAFSLITDEATDSADILIADSRSPVGLQAVARARRRACGTSVVLIVPEEASTAVAGASRHILSIERLTLQLLPVLNRVVETGLVEPQTRHGTGQPPASDTTGVAASPAGTAPVPRVPAAGKNTSVPVSQPPAAAPESAGAAENAGPGHSPPARAEDRAPEPAAQRPSAPANLVVFPRSAERPPPPRVRVLIVDDSPTVRHQLTVALSRTGLVCDPAASAEEALERLSRQHYDLALVDVVMPGVDGYKLTRQMRRRHRGLPVIILTSRSSPFDLARGALAGCDSYLVKPVPWRQLEAAVVKQLRRTLAIADFDRLTQAMARPRASPASPSSSAESGAGDRPNPSGASPGADSSGHAAR